ncbi:bifunctional hydroxymethylpyrimidine kinase/phosphomethylpyrimidine kinase [Kurthia massiliensis]|uniref:bifunctional hydroxymethylpyrimidine kinase/phosphomethylpyrimidine kinase n=1 Tax=Kurthia massiliensis TaxID=1033739 RepID=UPI00028A2794|nr:bifunctional hydroxymethylpyrimidine kinase/phosphomethylpyrimidine kinase [Kurthia massiliensis]
MIACSIAGSDSGGGAGIQADIKTFQELGVFATTAITSLTAQNTLGVHDIVPMTPTFLAHQLQAILDDFDVSAIKTGMLYDETLIDVVATILKEKEIPLVVDPVMVAKGGANLLKRHAVEALRQQLLPQTFICTPNIPEAEVITGMKIQHEMDVLKAAKQFIDMGVKHVVIKGGHAQGNYAIDYVVSETSFFSIETPRIQTASTHGTGCTFSAAITANLAKGLQLKKAIIEAKKYVQLAIAEPLGIGHGHGPTNHFAYKRACGQCEVIVHE